MSSNVRNPKNGPDSPDWKEIRARFEMGVSLAQIARDTGVPRSQIGERKRKEKWQVTRQGEKNKRVWEELGKRHGVHVEAGGPLCTYLEERGEEGKHLSTGPFSGPAAPVSGPDFEPQQLTAMDREVAKEIALLIDHQRQVGKARRIATGLLEKIEAVLFKGEAADFVRVKTPQGVEFRLPFLGQRESLSDALNKAAGALQKLIPLERQAHGLLPKESEQDSAPVVNISFGAFDAGEPAQTRTSERQGVTVDGFAYAAKRDTEHLSEGAPRSDSD